MANYFNPIDWNTADAQKEYDKRQSINDQIDIINQIGRNSGGSTSMKNALLQQYMGLFQPKEQDPNDQFGMALDLIATGDEKLKGIGLNMLTKSPLVSDYLGSDTQVPGSTNTLQNLYQEKGMTDFADNPEILAKITDTPALAQQYYQTPAEKQPWWNNILFGGMMGQIKTAGDLEKQRQNKIFGL